MNGLRFVLKTLSLLRIIIMLFIRSMPNCDFVRKNHQKRTRLKRLFKLYFLLIGSYNTNVGPEITSTTLTSFMIYSRLRSMMSLTLRIITNIVLGLLHILRSITMRRSLTFLKIIIRRKMIDPQGIKNDGTPFIWNNVQCWACDGFKHTAKTCHTPKHLVALYQKSLGNDKKVQGSGFGYEAHFSISTDSKFDADCSSKDPQNPNTNEPTLTVDDYMDSGNTIRFERYVW
jgi:hypothetical protein